MEGPRAESMSVKSTMPAAPAPRVARASQRFISAQTRISGLVAKRSVNCATWASVAEPIAPAKSRIKGGLSSPHSPCRALTSSKLWKAIPSSSSRLASPSRTSGAAIKATRYWASERAVGSRIVTLVFVDDIIDQRRPPVRTYDADATLPESRQSRGDLRRRTRSLRSYVRYEQLDSQDRGSGDGRPSVRGRDTRDRGWTCRGIVCA